jgi:hypothetical protein
LVGGLVAQVTLIGNVCVKTHKLLSYRSYESMADAHVDSSSPMDQLINESDPNSRKRGSVAASVRPPHDDQTSAKRPPVQPPKVTKCLHMIFW